MATERDELAELERLLSAGYRLVGYVLPLSSLSPDSVSNAVAVFSIQTEPRVLLDPSNRTKSLIMLRGPVPPIEIMTSDSRTIRRAEEQFRWQHEPIGMLISVRCVALGGSRKDERVFHLDRLVGSLDNLWGWHFKLAEDVGTFEAVKRLDSTDSRVAEADIDSLRLLLDCLAVSQKVGFIVQYYSVSPIPRTEPTISFGQEERMIDPVTPAQIEEVKTTLSSPDCLDAARGLNQGYAENWPPSRLDRLWAAAEAVFGSGPEPLLTEQEVNCLLGKARSIESLGNNGDRLNELEQALRNPDRLPRKSRNVRMAEAIAPVLGIPVETAKSEVRQASRLRAKHGHDISPDDQKAFESSERFLQEALLRYLGQIRRR